MIYPISGRGRASSERAARAPRPGRVADESAIRSARRRDITGAQQASDILLDVRDLELTFGGIRALAGLSLQIRKGEILSLIGPNGAGKTCLINCITGYYRPQRGSVLFQGHDLVGMPAHRIARLGVGRTFQDPTTYAGMTALDILMAARFSHGRTTLLDAVVHFGRSRREEIANLKIAEEIIRFVQIEELRKQRLAAMSYGQRKQVEIARALAMEPTILFLDEPMSGLDEVMKEIVNDLILAVHQKGVTVVLIEHDFQAVTELSHAVVVLAGGLKIAQGAPEEISSDPAVREAYLGSAAGEPAEEVRV